MDELLRPLCQSHDAHTRAALIEDILLIVAQPIIQRVLRSQLRADNEAEDNSQEAMLRVWLRLQSLSERNRIDDFGQWVASLTINLCRDTWRSRAPQRVRLKRQLRCLLRKDETFRFEPNGSDEWLCGLAEWRDATEHHNGKHSLDDLAALFGDSVVSLDSREPLGSEIITGFLRCIGHPLEFNELVSVMVAWQGNREKPFSLPGEIVETESAATMQFKLLLRQLWRIVHRLPLAQRRVLALGELPEYETALANLWLMNETITTSDLVSWLEMSIASLPDLLSELPLSNAALSEQFSLTRDQITKARYRALQQIRTELNEDRTR